MKKLLMMVFILLSFVLISCEYTFTPLDEIHKYTITVDPNDDGTLNMTYYLKWEVLEEGDGGVDFITVGVANRFVKDITGLTNNINDIYYSSDDGATIRIDFNNTYHEGDIFEVAFSFKQERIFTVVDNEVQYSFNPGWFEEIKVKELVVLWENNNILKSNADEITDKYYIWRTGLNYGETIDVNLVYDRSVFPTLNPDEDYSDQTSDPIGIIIFVVVILVFILTIIIIAKINEDKYQTTRGFSGHISHHHFWFGRYRGYRRSGKEITPPKVVNSGGSGVRGGGCACACACACAGGGRAGCSRKDFNNYLEI